MGPDEINRSATPATAYAAEHRSVWVYAGPDGRLVYGTTPSGDQCVHLSAMSLCASSDPR